MFGDWKAALRYVSGRITPNLFIYRTGSHGRMEFVSEIGKGTLTVVTVEEGQAEPYIEFPMEILEALYDELAKKYGHRAGSHTEGKLEAMEEHLADVRHLLKLPSKVINTRAL